MTPQEKVLVVQEVEQILKKGVIKVVQQDRSLEENSAQYFVLFVQPSDEFGKSQSLHSLLPFQNGRVIPVERNITGRGLNLQNRPQGCIFFSPTKPEIPKVCKFQMEGSILSVPLPLLPFGTSPKDIHKVDENSHSLLIKLHVRLIIFLDNILLMASSKEELTLARDTLIYLLQNLGFLINRKKLVLEPCQNIQFLGM